MSDDWESFHGLNPNSGSDDTMDLDSDGDSNIEEFYSGTIPTRAASTCPGAVIFVENIAYGNGTGTLADPYGSIKMGFDMAPSQGPVVIVALPGTYSGTYNNNLDPPNIELTLTGAGPAAGIIIDGGDTSRVVNYRSGHTTSMTLRNLRIINGYSGDMDGGGAIRFDNRPLILMHVTFEDCESDQGGAVYCSGSAVQIRRCSLITNKTLFYGSGGGAVSLLDCDNSVIESTSFTGNTAHLDQTGGLGASDFLNYRDEQRYGAPVTVVNSIIYDNEDGSAGANDNIAYRSGSTVDHTCSHPEETGTGNTEDDPGFVDFAGGDYRLDPASATATHNTGDNGGVLGCLDLDHNPRILDSNVDMGAYEIQLPVQ